MIFVRVDKESADAYEDADQAVIDKETGSLVVYKWLKIGPYKCPMKRQEVARYAAGKWMNFN